MAYYLNRPRLRVVDRDEKGRVTYRKRYKFGDKVDTSHMSDAHVENLVSHGSLVTSRDDLGDRPGRLVPYPGSHVAGAATGEAADHSEYFDAPEEESTTEEDDEPGDEEDSEQVDEYTSMDYQELQDAAKAANPPIPANQSADDLREALRAQAS